jgi:hypothetical protein
MVSQISQHANPPVVGLLQTIDRAIFGSAISILRAVERNQKKITDFNHSPESQTVSKKKILDVMINVLFLKHALRK